MANQDQQRGQQYSGDLHAGRVSADGQVRGYGMGNMAGVNQGAGQPQQNQGGQAYRHYGMRPGYGQVQQGYQPHYGQYGQQSQQAYGQTPYGQTGQPTYTQQAQVYPGQPQGYVPPITSQPQQLQQRRKRKPLIWIAIIIAILAIVAIIWLVLFGGGESLTRDPNQAAGQLEGKTPEEIQAELNRQVEEGMFNISIASVIEFADGASPGEVRIENVPGNRYLMQVTIARDDTGETLFTSGIIEPDHHIQTAPLDVDLDAGQYACTATFHALDPTDETEIGQAAAKVTINVLA